MRLKVIFESGIDVTQFYWRVVKLSEDGSIYGFGTVYSQDGLYTPSIFIRTLNNVTKYEDYAKLPHLIRAYRDNAHYIIHHATPKSNPEQIIENAVGNLALLTIISKQQYAILLGQAPNNPSSFHDEDEFEFEGEPNAILLLTKDGIFRRVSETDEDLSHIISAQPLQTKLAEVQEAAKRFLKLEL